MLYTKVRKLREKKKRLKNNVVKTKHQATQSAEAYNEYNELKRYCRHRQQQSQSTRITNRFQNKILPLQLNICHGGT